MMPAIGSCAPATWCAVTPTDHLSEVTFFQSASVSFSSVSVISAALASNCLANPSARALMGVPPVCVVDLEPFGDLPHRGVYTASGARWRGAVSREDAGDLRGEVAPRATDRVMSKRRQGGELARRPPIFHSDLSARCAVAVGVDATIEIQLPRRSAMSLMPAL